MKNQEIANIFYEMADILDMQNVAWKPIAYRRAARAIENLSEPIEKMYERGGIKELREIAGVGEGLAKKIAQYLDIGKVKEYEKLKKQVPKHISVLMKIPGMGPKKVSKLNKTLRITTVAQLEKAAILHKIAKLQGFGEKSEQDILDSILLFKKSKGKIPLAQAEKAANELIKPLKKLKEVLNISVAGSVRRRKAFVGDLDILACSKNPSPVIDAFTKLKNVQKVLAKGPTKATIILKSGIQADLRVLPPESWGAGLLYFTGNKTYNIDCRKIAIQKGYKLSEYGLFDKQTGKMVAGKTEKEVLDKLGLNLLKPEEREM